MCVVSNHTYGRRTFSGVCLTGGQYGVLDVYILYPHCSQFSFFSLFFLLMVLSFSLFLQLFVIVVWNFELYMIPLALLLPLAWNYILIASGKDTRQDVVSNPIASDIPPPFFHFTVKASFHTQCRVKTRAPLLHRDITLLFYLPH